MDSFNSSILFETLPNIDVPHIKQRFTISVSIGIAGTAENWKDLFHQADQSLFRAKALGKNKVAG